MASKNSSYYSFIIVMPGGGRSISLRLSRIVLSMILTTMTVLLISLGVGIYLTSTATYKSQAYTSLEIENQVLKKSISEINDNVDQLQSQYIKIVDKEDELKLLLGDIKLRGRNYYQKKKIKSKINNLNKTYTSLGTKREDEPNQVGLLNRKINFLNQKMIDNNLMFDYFLDKTYQMKARFASTPSIRPIYGRIQSTYGNRYHPIHRRIKLHRGIDFASWTGAPIQATADGIIEYSGWSGSFGFVIVIDHDYGYRTLYAHCSQLLVDQGEIVKKGQIIAQVGTTGISTGPHLHYEVKKRKRAVNPIAYLDLDMFTASKKVW